MSMKFSTKVTLLRIGLGHGRPEAGGLTQNFFILFLQSRLIYQCWLCIICLFAGSPENPQRCVRRVGADESLWETDAAAEDAEETERAGPQSTGLLTGTHTNTHTHHRHITPSENPGISDYSSSECGVRFVCRWLKCWIYWRIFWIMKVTSTRESMGASQELWDKKPSIDSTVSFHFIWSLSTNPFYFEFWGFKVKYYRSWSICWH